MLHWSDELYIGEGIADRVSSVRAKLDAGDYSENAWLITLSTNRKNQLDIIHTVFLREHWIRKSLPLIVGIASGKTEAMRLTGQILLESLATHCGPDMRMYLVEKRHTVS